MNRLLDRGFGSVDYNGVHHESLSQLLNEYKRTVANGAVEQLKRPQYLVYSHIGSFEAPGNIIL